MGTSMAHKRGTWPAFMRWAGLLAVATLMLAARCLGEDESTDRPTVQKTKEKLHFQLPVDWPVEKRGGVVSPIPVEEYLARKFKDMDARFQTVDQQLRLLEGRLQRIEERTEAREPGLRSLESPVSSETP